MWKMVFYKPSCIRELHFFNFELNWIYEMSTRHSFYSTLTLTSCAMHTRIQQNDSMQTGKNNEIIMVKQKFIVRWMWENPCESAWLHSLIVLEKRTFHSHNHVFALALSYTRTTNFSFVLNSMHLLKLNVFLWHLSFPFFHFACQP